MRIGIIRYRYTPYGGAEVFVMRLINGLLEKGHIVEVFSSNWEGEEGGVAGGGRGGWGGRMILHRVDASGPSFLRPAIFARNALRAVEAAAPDIVLSLERTYCQDIYRAGDGVHREWLQRRKRAASPLKRLLISLNPLHMTLLSLEKRLFSSPRLKKVIANSRMVSDDIQRHYGLPRDKICVIYNGVNLKEFSPLMRSARQALRRGLGIRENSFVILFVGSGFERKGLNFLMRSVRLLREKRKDTVLIVVGKGRQGKYLKEADALGIKEGVFFRGPSKDTAKYYALSDVFALPSIYEPFSNACLEALASGLPVVTTRANGASEIITEGVNGSIVEDPSDHEELSRRISIFLDAKRLEMAAIAARSAAERFPIERTVGSILELMEELAGKRGEAEHRP